MVSKTLRRVPDKPRTLRPGKAYPSQALRARVEGRITVIFSHIFNFFRENPDPDTLNYVYFVSGAHGFLNEHVFPAPNAKK